MPGSVHLMMLVFLGAATMTLLAMTAVMVRELWRGR